VRPAGLIWHRSFFERLGGFDSRFESAEDFHLVLRAGWAGARVSRSSVPKQYYCVPPGNHNFSPLHIEGHRRLFEWIQANSPYAHPASLEMWLAKECVYEAFVSIKRGLRHFPSFLTFLSRR
jgi:predicted glycosyltransferase involved in capsule biosynthesis